LKPRAPVSNTSPALSLVFFFVGQIVERAEQGKKLLGFVLFFVVVGFRWFRGGRWILLRTSLRPSFVGNIMASSKLINRD